MADESDDTGSDSPDQAEFARSLDRVRKMRQIGARLVGLSIGALAAGGAIAKVLRPWLQNIAIGDALPLLVPIWFVGVAGLICLYLAWATAPCSDERLDDAVRRVIRPRTSIRLLATLVLVWMILASVLMPWLDDSSPRSIRIAIGYLMGCWGCLGMFLFYRYCEARHRAMTTYLNVLRVPFAFAMIPFTWLLLVYFQSRPDA